MIVRYYAYMRNSIRLGRLGTGGVTRERRCAMPLKRPTTTPAPDEIFDEWLDVLGHAELRVLLYIVRRTFGFGKRGGDSISFAQFLTGITTRDGRVLDKGCGVRNRTNLSRALVSLEARGLIHSYKRLAPPGDKAVTVYALRFEDADKPTDDPRESRPIALSDGPKGGSTAAVPPSTATVPPSTATAPRGSTVTVPGVVPQRYLQETGQQQTAIQQTVKYSTDVIASTVLTAAQHHDGTAPTVDGAATEVWRCVLDEVRTTMTVDNYRRWFTETRADRWDGTTLRVVAPSDFDRHWLNERLRRHVERAMARLGQGDMVVTFVIDSP